MDVFQSSFELTGYITIKVEGKIVTVIGFQSSFELTGYITFLFHHHIHKPDSRFQSSFELTGYITEGGRQG